MADMKMSRDQLLQARSRKQLADAAPRLIARLLELSESSNEQTALSATKTALDYIIAKPKEAQRVDVNVTSNTAAQLSALAARANQLNSLGNLADRGKLSINHAPIIDAVAVPVTPDSVDEADSRNR